MILQYRAAILERLNAPLVLDEIQNAELGFGQVLVRVFLSGICGAQLQEIAGQKGNAKFLPHLLGHEGCGVVAATGPGVTNVKPGQRVVMHWRKGAGMESDFPRYLWRGKEMRSGLVTTFAEYSVCSENRLTAVPDDTPMELCALLGCGLSTALGTAEHDAAIQFGERVLVVGVGGLGANLIQACRLRGGVVTACDLRPEKAKLADDMCAADFFASNATEWAKKRDFDCIIDTAGHPETMAKAIGCLAPSGRYVMVGQPPPAATVELLNAAHLFGGDGKVIRATQGGGFRPHVDIPRYVRLWQSGALDLSKLVTRRINLDQINEGIAAVRAGEAGRVLVDML